MGESYSHGEIVRAKSRLGRIGSGRYRIVGLVPRGDEVLLYRVRSVVTGVEWVVAHDGIESASAIPGHAGR